MGIVMEVRQRTWRPRAFGLTTPQPKQNKRIFRVSTNYMPIQVNEKHYLSLPTTCPSIIFQIMGFEPQSQSRLQSAQSLDLSQKNHIISFYKNLYPHIDSLLLYHSLCIIGNLTIYTKGPIVNHNISIFILLLNIVYI